MEALVAGRKLSTEDRCRIRRRMMFDHFKWDPQSGDQDVLAEYPVILSADLWAELKCKAEALAAELYAAEKEILCRPELFRSLGIPGPIIRAISGRKARGVPDLSRFMRFDFHLTRRGWMISEVNADVPGGFIEASALTELMLAHFPDCVSSGDPSLRLAQSIISRIPGKGTLAFVHATAYADDRQVMEFLGRYFRDRDFRVFFAGPRHVRWQKGKASLSGPFGPVPLDAVIRFFPAEWLMNLPWYSRWEDFFAGGETLQVNPPEALLVQSKKFPLLFDRLQTPLNAWKALCPVAREITDAPLKSGRWVVKPVFSRVGEGLFIQGVSDPKENVKILKAARRNSRYWVAQERFDAVPLVVDGLDKYLCVGVYVIDQAACGIYGRIADRPLIDHRAKDVAVLIRKG